jgi:hypothetical protein
MTNGKWKIDFPSAIEEANFPFIIFHLPFSIELQTRRDGC